MLFLLLLLLLKTCPQQLLHVAPRLLLLVVEQWNQLPAYAPDAALLQPVCRQALMLLNLLVWMRSEPTAGLRARCGTIATNTRCLCKPCSSHEQVAKHATWQCCSLLRLLAAPQRKRTCNFSRPACQHQRCCC
jgi:hypothetical protein